MVALEAMERARPVIAAAIGGLEELVRDGETGLLVAPGDAEPLRGAMLELAGNLDARRARWAARAAHARAARFPRGALRRPDRDPLPLGAAPRRRAAVRSAILATENSLLRPLQAGLAHRRGPRRVGEQRRSARGQRVRVVRRDEHARLAVDDELRARSCPRVATTGFAASIASSSASPKPSQRAGWTSSSARRYHAATSPTRPGRKHAVARLEPRALRPLAEHDEHRAAARRSRTRASARTATSTPFCSRQPARRRAAARVVRQRRAPGSRPRAAGSSSSP